MKTLLLLVLSTGMFAQTTATLSKTSLKFTAPVGEFRTTERVDITFSAYDCPSSTSCIESSKFTNQFRIRQTPLWLQIDNGDDLGLGITRSYGHVPDRWYHTQPTYIDVCPRGSTFPNSMLTVAGEYHTKIIIEVNNTNTNITKIYEIPVSVTVLPPVTHIDSRSLYFTDAYTGATDLFHWSYKIEILRYIPTTFISTVNVPWIIITPMDGPDSDGWDPIPPSCNVGYCVMAPGWDSTGRPAFGASLNVSVDPRRDPKSPSIGTITISIPGEDPQIITVEYPFAAPIITGLGSAADYNGKYISPGEIVVIFGKNFGPSKLAGMQLKTEGANTIAATEIGETRVFFDGIPAPMVYAIEGQISCVVPYEVKFSKYDKITTRVVVEYKKVKSAAASSICGGGSWVKASGGCGYWVPVVEAMPAIFSLAQTGIGQGAILNQDYSVNGTLKLPGMVNSHISWGTPAIPGSVIMVYATGEGKTDTPINGLITPVAPPYPKPLLTSWSATIGGQYSRVWFAGSAPGSIAGLFQINLAVPYGLVSGNHELIIQTIDSNGLSNQWNAVITSQMGITVAVK